jgi:hypothetical protein
MACPCKDRRNCLRFRRRRACRTDHCGITLVVLTIVASRVGGNMNIFRETLFRWEIVVRTHDRWLHHPETSPSELALVPCISGWFSLWFALSCCLACFPCTILRQISLLDTICLSYMLVHTRIRGNWVDTRWCPASENQTFST